MLLCWGKTELVPVMKACKFIGLLGGNMLAVTNMAICVNLAIIVYASMFSLSNSIPWTIRLWFLIPLTSGNYVL